MDAFVTVRHGDTQRSVWISDALDSWALAAAVGGFRIDLSEPLRALRLVCEHPDLSVEMSGGLIDAGLEDR